VQKLFLAVVTTLALAVPSVVALVPAPASAQMTFEGLDLSDDDAQKPAKSKKKKTGKAKAPPAETAPVPAAPEAATPAAPAAEAAKPAEKPAPTMSFEGLDVTGKTADRQKLEAAMRLFDDKNYEAASLAFQGILEDPNAADQHSQARYLLAKALYRMGLYHSSLQVFRDILGRGEDDKFFKTSLEWLFFISHKTVAQTVVLDEIAKWANVQFPEKYRDEFRYLLAKYNFVRGMALTDAAAGADGKEQSSLSGEAAKSLAETRRLAALVSHDSRFYPKARYLEGLTLYVGEKFEPAVEAFKDVVRATNPRTGAVQDPSLREQAFMQLARIHYEHQQNRYAIFYYDKVPRGGEQWLESLYESSWAHFRIGQYERALGNMITLHSPFFRDEYFPEALILKAVIYYENCRYPEATQIVDEFNRTYLPLHREIEAVLSRNYASPQDYYDLLADIQKKDAKEKGETGKLLERILKLALSDKELAHLNESILELEGEMDAINGHRDLFRFSSLAKRLGEALKAQRDELQARAGIFTKRKLEKERRELAELNYRALAIRAEIGTREKDVLQASLEQGSRIAVVKKYKFSAAVDDEHVFWPYEGEFWRDELGTYQYTLTKGCKDR
jgi:outer membrane protein assembly factor BamD (BamD/ComL family)